MLLLGLLGLIGLPLNTPAQAQDLTGIWEASDGSLYYIRQTGNEVFWHGRSANAGNGQGWTNVFYSYRQDQTITGRWADLPPGRARNEGTVQLKILSANRFVGEFLNGKTYNQEWTRRGTPSGDQGGGRSDTGGDQGKGRYRRIPSTEISGHNILRLANVTVADCETACDQRSDCLTFDYSRNQSACYLQDTGKGTVSSNSYDHYIKPGVGSQKTLPGEIFVQLDPPSDPGSDQGGGTSITWSTSPSKMKLRGRNGQRFSFSCPSREKEATGFAVWGTDIYTDDSYICGAAIHAGRITKQGGTVTIEIRAGQSSYTGTTRNGIRTRRYGPFGGSFVFAGS